MFANSCVGVKLDQASENPHGREALPVRDLRQAVQLGIKPEAAHANSSRSGKLTQFNPRVELLVASC